MKRVEVKITNELKLKGVMAYFEKEVTNFGTGAKIDCPKEYLRKKVIVIVSKD